MDCLLQFVSEICDAMYINFGPVVESIRGIYITVLRASKFLASITKYKLQENAFNVCE